MLASDGVCPILGAIGPARSEVPVGLLAFLVPFCIMWYDSSSNGEAYGGARGALIAAGPDSSTLAASDDSFAVSTR